MPPLQEYRSLCSRTNITSPTERAYLVASYAPSALLFSHGVQTTGAMPSSGNSSVIAGLKRMPAACTHPTTGTSASTDSSRENPAGATWLPLRRVWQIAMAGSLSRHIAIPDNTLDRASSPSLPPTPSLKSRKTWKQSIEHDGSSSRAFDGGNTPCCPKMLIGRLIHHSALQSRLYVLTTLCTPPCSQLPNCALQCVWCARGPDRPQSWGILGRFSAYALCFVLHLCRVWGFAGTGDSEQPSTSRAPLFCRIEISSGMSTLSGPILRASRGSESAKSEVMPSPSFFARIPRTLRASYELFLDC